MHPPSSCCSALCLARCSAWCRSHHVDRQGLFGLPNPVSDQFVLVQTCRVRTVLGLPVSRPACHHRSAVAQQIDTLDVVGPPFKIDAVSLEHLVAVHGEPANGWGLWLWRGRRRIDVEGYLAHILATIHLGRSQFVSTCFPRTNFARADPVHPFAIQIDRLHVAHIPTQGRTLPSRKIGVVR